jgi:hypothetical protein
MLSLTRSIYIRPVVTKRNVNRSAAVPNNKQNVQHQKVQQIKKKLIEAIVDVEEMCNTDKDLTGCLNAWEKVFELETAYFKNIEIEKIMMAETYSEDFPDQRRTYDL